MGYGAHLKDLGVVRNALAFTGKAQPTALNNLQPRKAVALPQWLIKTKEIK